MLTRLKNALARWFVPSHGNEYHPHVLAERGLLAVLALILGAEGFLVSNIVASIPGPVPLAAVGNVNTIRVLPPLIASAAHSWTAQVIEPLARIAALHSAASVAFIVLLCTLAGLMGVLALTLSARRRRLMPVGYIAGGTMLGLAAAFVLFDTHFIFPAARAEQAVVLKETAAVVAVRAQPFFGVASSTASTTLQIASSTQAASSTPQEIHLTSPTKEQ